MRHSLATLLYSGYQHDVRLWMVGMRVRILGETVLLTLLTHSLVPTWSGLGPRPGSATPSM